MKDQHILELVFIFNVANMVKKSQEKQIYLLVISLNIALLLAPFRYSPTTAKIEFSVALL